jgi:exodeoxyribonuclease-5/deoxyribonuclease V
MILAFDTYYFDNKARTVCLAFSSWENDASYDVYTEELEGIADYEPGAFYKRELPCILSLLKQIGTEKTIEAIIVDGFVWLDDERKPGLGAHLYNALHAQVPVIGVAKTNFATIEQLKYELYRGTSQRPLYITAAGMDLIEAAEKIRHMSGEHRIPALLKKLDGLTKGNA